MSTSTDIKTWEDRADAEHGFLPGDAWKTVYMLAEIAELRAALEAADQKLAQNDAQMLRMAQCAGEFAKDAAKKVDVTPYGWITGIGSDVTEDVARDFAYAKRECDQHNAYERSRADFDPSEHVDRVPQPLYSQQHMQAVLRANLELTRRYDEQKLQEKRLETALERAKVQPDSGRDAGKIDISSLDTWGAERYEITNDRTGEFAESQAEFFLKSDVEEILRQSKAPSRQIMADLVEVLGHGETEDAAGLLSAATQRIKSLESNKLGIERDAALLEVGDLYANEAGRISGSMPVFSTTVTIPLGRHTLYIKAAQQGEAQPLPGDKP